MRILWKNPTTTSIKNVDGFEKMENELQKQLNKVAEENTEIIVTNLETSTNTVRSFYGEFLNNFHVVESILQEQYDYDAVIIGCFPDPGIHVLKEVAEVPIIGLGEAAMLIATTLGEKFAVISVDNKINPNMEQSFLKYKLSQRAIYRPIREVHPAITVFDDIEGYVDPYKSIIPRIEETAKECIKEGAEVILTGCGYMGPMLTKHGYNMIRGTNVPIIDSSAVAVKFAEMMVGLRHTIGMETSRACYFEKPAVDFLNIIRKNVGLKELTKIPKPHEYDEILNR